MCHRISSKGFIENVLHASIYFTTTHPSASPLPKKKNRNTQHLFRLHFCYFCNFLLEFFLLTVYESDTLIKFIVKWIPVDWRKEQNSTSFFIHSFHSFFVLYHPQILTLIFVSFYNILLWNTHTHRGKNARNFNVFLFFNQPTNQLSI